jgi:uncharacterized protein YbbC (DUF1343 family)
VTVLSGLDRLAMGDEVVCGLVRGRRIGLLAHAASVTQRFVPALDVVRAQGGRVKALFGPEHGWAGSAQDMIAVGPSAGALPVHTLYGATESSLSPTPEMLAGLDAIVIDLSDVGARYYTFVWTAALAMQAAAKAGVETIVLDRPNPLGGDVLEGAPQRPGYRSFVGLYDVPVRHGMTLGELCRMVRELEGLDERALTLVAMRGWRRAMRFRHTGLPWIQPSPNMPTEDTATVYPGGCLLEGTNASEGRGTTRPFEVFGAPGLGGEALRDRVGPIDGAALRPLAFEPTFHKHARTLCGGVQVHVTDGRRFAPYAAYLRILMAMRELSPGFRWRTETYEFVSDRPAIDLLTGGPEARIAIDAGDRDALAQHLAGGEAAARRFAELRRPWLVY